MDNRKCRNVPLLVEHAVMDSFSVIEDLATLYKCLGDEFGKGHLSPQETILIINLFDEKLLATIERLMKEQGVSEYNVSTHRLYDSVRSEFKNARALVEIHRLSESKEPIPECHRIKPFEWPKPTANLHEGI
jgi:hypothetical protein